MRRICVFEKGHIENTLPTMFMGPAMTFMVDDEVIAVIGLSVLWPGVASVWSVIGDVENHVFWFHRNSKRILNEAVHACNIHRVQAAISKNDQRAIRWIRSLGFHMESTMKKFGTDQSDYFNFVRF